MKFVKPRGAKMEGSLEEGIGKVKPGGAKMELYLGQGIGKDSTGDATKSNADFRSMFLK